VSVVYVVYSNHPELTGSFSILGPQSHVGSGNLLIVMEAELAYAAKALNKCQREGYRSMVVKDEAVQSFLQYTDNYFGRTVFTTECKSWYKSGADGAIRTLWPGSSQHALVALREPRWEDWDWEREKGYTHPMAWLGDGHVSAKLDPAFYVDELRAGHTEHPLFT
jgi:hypothetical protein